MWFDTLPADGAGLGSREAVTQGERRQQPPWDPIENGLYVDYPLTAVLHDDQAAALDAMLTTLTARARALADSAETPTHV